VEIYDLTVNQLRRAAAIDTQAQPRGSIDAQPSKDATNPPKDKSICRSAIS
jgi:hypothetical protein